MHSHEENVEDATVKRRVEFQKSYSQEMGGWRKRSLIDDAKFETLANKEFAKREQGVKQSEISDKDSIEQSTSPLAKQTSGPETSKTFLIKLKDLGRVSDIVKVIESTTITLSHLEIRERHKKNEHLVEVVNRCPLDLYLQCRATKDQLEVLSNSIKRALESGEHCDRLITIEDKPTLSTTPWFPRHVADLDNCTHLVTKFEPDLDYDHPGFTDKEYRQRRKEIADIAFSYKHGQVIQRVEYTLEERNTWKHVYTQLKSLHPSHACQAYIKHLNILEDECGYNENNIPQLQDVSAYLKRKTGFQLRPVAGLVSPRDFLTSLAFRVFQCTQYIRHKGKPDYSPEPSPREVRSCFQLYWFTVEFGLCMENGNLRAYGAGTLSAYGELKHALSCKPKHFPFDPEVTAVQQYDDNDFQPVFFYVESFDEMMSKVRQFASRLKRPYEIHYDPYTQNICPLDSKNMLRKLSNDLHGQVEVLQRAINRINDMTIFA